MSAAAAPPLYTRYGFVRTGDPKAPLRIEPYPEVCTGGALRAAVIASAVDLVGGFVTREAAGTDATFTTDLSLRIPEPGVPGALAARAEPLRIGRRLVATSVRLETADGTAYAYGETTFTRIPREEPLRDAAALATPATIPFHPLARPLAEEVGVEVSNAAAGRVVLPLRPALLNPEGTLQGALVALLCECAALARAGAASERPAHVTELDLRYLATASAGPVEAQATWIGPADRGMLRVELRDRGRSDRRTATALVRVDATPPS